MMRTLTYDDFTHDDFTKAILLLESLTPDIVVERHEPAPDHIFVSFVVPDTAQPSAIFAEYLEPAIQDLAKILPDTPKAVTQILHTPPAYMKCYNFSDSVWPLRCSVAYDIPKEGYLIVLDLLCGPSQ
jgi:hypothetical protein